IGCPGGEQAGGLRDPAVHAVVNRIDPRRDGEGLSLGTEAESEHRVERTAKALRPPPPLTAEGAVIGNALSHQGMRELEQNGGAPGQKQDDFSLKLPGYAHTLRPCEKRGLRLALTLSPCGRLARSTMRSSSP